MDPKFERIVLKSGPFHYMKIKLDFLGAKANVDSDIFKSVIVDALSELHGDVGAAMAVDILYFDCKTTEGIIRVPSKGLVKIWSALTLFSSYGNTSCNFRVNKVSPHLASLSVDSRHFMSQLVPPK